MSARPEIRYTICRICAAHCPLIATSKPDGALALHGDKDNPLYHGFSCVKGREIYNVQRGESRLLHSLRRLPDGRFEPIEWEAMAAEVAERLARIIADHGPRSVASYIGTYGYYSQPGMTFLNGLMNALGSRMIFTSATIDQPGRILAQAMHGAWLAGTPASDQWDALLLIGTNPVVSMNGALGPNPARRLRELRARGMKMVAIDPRLSETARHADIALQCRPGTDAQILAGFARAWLHAGLVDADFLSQECVGLDELQAAVEPFSFDLVANVAGVSENALREAATLLGTARVGAIAAGTGNNMSGQSTLSEYLVLALTSLRGWWLRAGDEKPNPGVLIQPPPAVAATLGPFAAGTGEASRIRGLQETMLGMPTATLSDEILTPGEGRVRALIVLGGNPALAFPDQAKAHAAMRDLDLLIVVDPVLSATARSADFVFAPKLSLEVQDSSAIYELFGNFGSPGMGFERPYAQFSQPLLEPPAGSDVAEDYEFIHAIARKMDLTLRIKPMSMLDPAEAERLSTRVEPGDRPDSDAVWKMLLNGSPVPYEEVRDCTRGRIFERPRVTVAPRPDGWIERLNLGDAGGLAELAATLNAINNEDTERPFRLIGRRMRDVMNSSWHDNPPQLRQWAYNPAFMNPGDIEALSIAPGRKVRIRSAHGDIVGVVQADPAVRTGCVSMSHCWGQTPDQPEDPLIDGSNTGRLLADDTQYDRVSGIPLMSGIPISLEPVDV